MVILVTKTSCPRREMTSLALTVCAHIAATLYTPRFCAFEHRFLPFPNLTPNPPSALPYASLVVEVMEKEMGMAPAGVPYASRVVEVLGRGMGMASGVMPYASPLVGAMGGIMRWSSAVPRSIRPKACSYFSTFSCNAMSRRLACSGAIIILLATSGLGMPGNACAKSITKSLCEWLINTRLA